MFAHMSLTHLTENFKAPSRGVQLGPYRNCPLRGRRGRCLGKDSLLSLVEPDADSERRNRRALLRRLGWPGRPRECERDFDTRDLDKPEACTVACLASCGESSPDPPLRRLPTDAPGSLVVLTTGRRAFSQAPQKESRFSSGGFPHGAAISSSPPAGCTWAASWCLR